MNPSIVRTPCVRAYVRRASSVASHRVFPEIALGRYVGLMILSQGVEALRRACVAYQHLGRELFHDWCRDP